MSALQLAWDVCWKLFWTFAPVLVFGGLLVWIVLYLDKEDDCE